MGELLSPLPPPLQLHKTPSEAQPTTPTSESESELRPCRRLLLLLLQQLQSPRSLGHSKLPDSDERRVRVARRRDAPRPPHPAYETTRATASGTDPAPSPSFSPSPPRLCSRSEHAGGPQGQVAQSGQRRCKCGGGAGGRAGGEGQDWPAQGQAGSRQVADQGPAALRAERATAARALAGESAAAHARTTSRCLGMCPPCCSSVPAPILATAQRPRPRLEDH